MENELGNSLNIEGWIGLLRGLPSRLLALRSFFSSSETQQTIFWERDNLQVSSNESSSIDAGGR